MKGPLSKGLFAWRWKNVRHQTILGGEKKKGRD